MHSKTVTILLRIRGHFVMSITKKHESHYVTVLDNPQVGHYPRTQVCFFSTVLGPSRWRVLL